LRIFLSKKTIVNTKSSILIILNLFIKNDLNVNSSIKGAKIIAIIILDKLIFVSVSNFKVTVNNVPIMYKQGATNKIQFSFLFFKKFSIQIKYKVCSHLFMRTNL
ncbi:MAG: hypothetical protein RSH24_17485, partial [Flavobacterium sp.]